MNFRFEGAMLASDNELLGRYVFGDDSNAFEELLRRHAALVMSVCRNMLLRTEDAEDAFQATFLVLSKKARTLIDRNSIAGWLYHVAMRNCLEIRRRGGKRREEEMVVEPQAVENEPWRSISQAQECDLIYQELSRLPRRYRDVIVLCHLQGYSRSDAAELLDWTESAVKAALSRARNLLRRRLVRQGVMTTSLLVLLQESVVEAHVATSESLLESTLQICSGRTSTDMHCSDLNLVQSIARQGAQSMNSSFLVKAGTAVLGLALISCVPLLVLAKNPVKSEAQAVVLHNPGAAAKPVESQQVRIETGPNNPQEQNPPAESEKQDKKTTPPGPFKISESIEYWELIRRASQIKQQVAELSIARADRLRRVASTSEDETMTQRLTLQAEIVELEAQMLEARLNIERILHEQKHGAIIDRAVIPPASDTAVRPGETLLIEYIADELNDRRVVVQADHTIALPLVGTIDVKGLTLAELTLKIKQSHGKYFKDPQIFVCRASASMPIEIGAGR